eukprot:jgi/Tetstr1/428555/TSEL_018549.t1
MGDLSAAEERIYEEREDARTIASGLRKETTPRHERFDGATSIWTEWFSSYNANVLVPYALAKAPPRPAPRADGAGSSEGESTGPEWVFSPADSLQLLQEYVEINAVTMPIIDQWQKDTLRYQQQTLRFDPASGRIRVPSREDADAFHEFRYRRYVELFETKFNEAPKMRTSSAQPCASTTPLVAVAAVEAAEAQAEVAVVVMAVDAAMEAHPEADEDRAGTLDLEAMFSRVLEKSLAAHGAMGAMRLAVEVPDPFLDCVDTDDHGTLLHGASCLELPVRSARNPELCMRQPGWDAQREQLTKQRPQGFEPVVEHEAPASYEGRRGGGAITSDMLDICDQQLLQHLRTALQHAKFPGLPVAVVSDITPEHAARWLEARDTAMRGGIDTRDHMAVAWETVLQQAVRRFEATARLTWVDYTHLDLTRVFAAAVQSVYGLSLPRISVPPLSSPSAEPQANIHTVDVVQHGVKPLEARRQLSATSSELSSCERSWGGEAPDVAANLTSSFSFNSRIELQPDNVGADTAVQPEQQDDEASKAELPELVADSDDEEDFVPCWVEDEPGHVANVIASCFTLRASPMDADSDSDEELPDLMEESSDDDDFYEELTIMTQTRPEVEAALDSEPLASGACYALQAMSELNCMLAKARGVKEYWAAPA